MNTNLYNQPLTDMSIFLELGLIILITAALIGIAKLFTMIKINGKKLPVPLVMVVIITGFIIGLILRSIDPGFNFKIVPYFSMISVILLFIAFGSMIDFKAFKKFGVWTILLGVIPYIIEWIAITIIITLLTNLLWFEAGIIALMLSMCAPGVISPKIMDNIIKGYERENSYNETVSLAGAVENIFGLIITIVLVTVYQGSYKGGVSAGVIVALPVLLLIIGGLIGALMGALTFYVLKPAANVIIKTNKIKEEGLEDKELEEAKRKNEKSEFNNNTLVWAFLFVVAAAFYLTLQLVAGLGFLIMESGLVAGIIISLFGSKSEVNAKAQKTIARNSNMFYALLGCFIVWGFGGMLIDPAILAGNDWLSIGGKSNILPNVITSLIFIVIGVLFRIIGIFLTMSLNSEYTFKQKLYTIPVMLSTGTGGVNNGVTILLVLGVSATAGDQWTNALMMQSIMIVTGTIMTFTLIPVGVFLLGFGQDRLIFKWNSISEGQYNTLVRKEIKNLANKNEINEALKTFWDDFYSYTAMNKKAEKKNLESTKELETLKENYSNSSKKLNEVITQNIKNENILELTNKLTVEV